jgi:hypothetical protein
MSDALPLDDLDVGQVCGGLEEADGDVHGLADPSASITSRP